MPALAIAPDLANVWRAGTTVGDMVIVACQDDHQDAEQQDRNRDAERGYPAFVFLPDSMFHSAVSIRLG